MNDKMMTVVVSTDEYKYLQILASCSPTIAKLLASREPSLRKTVVFRVGQVQAEQIRDHLTESLAKVGFEIDYTLTAQGQMIEGLIDRFYLA